MKSDYLAGAALEIMQTAWRTGEPQTVAEMTERVNKYRTAQSPASSHLTRDGAVKCIGQLIDIGFLRRDKPQNGPTLYDATVTREQYMAVALQQLSRSIMGANAAEVFPALLGSSRKQSLAESDMIAALADVISEAQNDDIDE